MLDLSTGLNWLVAGGSGLIASYIFSWLEKQFPKIALLASDIKFGLVMLLTCFVSVGAWLLLLLSPDVVAPVGAWPWLNAIFVVCAKAITVNQGTYYLRFRAIRRAELLNDAFGG